MRKLTGVFLMSVMLALAACSGGQAPITKTYTSSQTVTIPAGVTNLILVSGQGSGGTAAYSYYDRQYSEHAVQYTQNNAQGGTITTFDRGTTYHSGVKPADYCEEHQPYPAGGGITNYTWYCYTYADTSAWRTEPATNGSASSGFGKTFPGGVGGPASSVTFNDVAVVAGQAYNIVVPTGGSITISYY